MQSLHGCESRHGSWTAVFESGPTRKPRLKVTGTCACPTGDFEVALRKADSQGMNHRVLVLQLTAKPPSGMAHEAMTEVKVTFELDDAPMYTDVRIVPFDISIPVESVS
ncbi:MAG: hypothetical protein ACLPYS_13220 [Vulcanimicrobiaceae bacterium]